MQMLEAIWKRRSVREYTNDPVTEDVIEELLRAGMQAPSARNLQPWQFVVVTDRSILEQVPCHHPYASMVPRAAAAVLVCGDTILQENPGYLALDCSAVTQNILLETTAQGLGAVWLGVYPCSRRILGMRKLFGLPGHILPVSLISIGHPASEPGEVDRFDPGRIHRDTW
jgi:nitroreductase